MLKGNRAGALSSAGRGEASDEHPQKESWEAAATPTRAGAGAQGFGLLLIQPRASPWASCSPAPSLGRVSPKGWTSLLLSANILGVFSSLCPCFSIVSTHTWLIEGTSDAHCSRHCKCPRLAPWHCPFPCTKSRSHPMETPEMLPARPSRQAGTEVHVSHPQSSLRPVADGAGR